MAHAGSSGRQASRDWLHAAPAGSLPSRGAPDLCPAEIDLLRGRDFRRAPSSCDPSLPGGPHPDPERSKDALGGLTYAATDIAIPPSLGIPTSSPFPGIR